MCVREDERERIGLRFVKAFSAKIYNLQLARFLLLTYFLGISVPISLYIILDFGQERYLKLTFFQIACRRKWKKNRIY